MTFVKKGAVVAASAVMLGASALPAVATTSGEAAVAASNPAYRILKHLDYSGPGKASLRVGYYDRSADKGFGWNKLKKKHNITKYSAVEYIAKSPNRERVGNTTTYHMTGYAGKYRCRNGVCTLVKQYKMILSVNEKIQRDNQDKGVITMYCKGVVWCPNWVSTALAKQNSRSLAAAESGEESSAVIPEAEAPDNSQAPVDAEADASEADDENTPVDPNAPAAEGDATDGSEVYLSSYAPLTNSVPAATATSVAGLSSKAANEKLTAAYRPLRQTIPAIEERYHYVGSYEPLK